MPNWIISDLILGWVDNVLQGFADLDRLLPDSPRFCLGWHLPQATVHVCVDVWTCLKRKFINQIDINLEMLVSN